MNQLDGRGDEHITPARPAAGTARPDRGSVTAEFALLLPVLVVLLTAVLSAATAGVRQLQCIDAARAGARAAARHDDARPAATAVGPEGAQVDVSNGTDSVTVRVSDEVSLPLPWHPHLTVGAENTAQVEPEAGP
ncbi:hypothetical protein GCM10022223_58490 [Kineosporia mesophila]|uniref:TadE-like domain-containing protein n=1 Tax=Kineosporia mesophila TaxID=566012 RepID=A0ABP7AH57_9ACTN|nr:TadE family type IV pilus minor pilin [Kineosporia mesophila]MCD5350791.1 pilus assembly protein [Kineosporia mesophila]